MTDQSFDKKLEKEAYEYLQQLNESRGVATTNRQKGQRKRRLREKLSQSSSIANEAIEFSDEHSMFQVGFNALIRKFGLSQTQSQDLEKYGSPPGAELSVDPLEEDEIIEDQDEIDTNYVISTNKEAFGGGRVYGSFFQWVRDVYIPQRPILRDMVYNNYWTDKKTGQLRFGSPRSTQAKNNAIKWVAYQVRKYAAINGIKPSSVVFTKSNTILNYDSKSHILRGRDG